MYHLLPYSFKVIGGTIKPYYYRPSKQHELEKRLIAWYYASTEKIFGHGRTLDLDHLVTFSEKLQWLKIYDHSKKRTQLSDKYLAKKLVGDIIGHEYIVPLYGVWDKYADIDFDQLPNSFALKVNHGNAWQLLVTDKSKIDHAKEKEHFDEWMSVNFFKAGLEMQYRDIKRRIFAEQLLKTSDASCPYDYRFWCFNGQPQFITVTQKNIHNNDLRASRFDLAFNHQTPPYSLVYPELEPLPPKPASFDRMVDFSKKLSKDFSFVRVDFYEIDGHPYFGEMTFTPHKGIMRWADPEYDQVCGRMLTLPMER